MPNCQLVRSIARCHGLAASDNAATTSRATSTSFSRTSLKNRSSRRCTEAICALLSMQDASRVKLTVPAVRMLAINQPRVSHLDRASRIWSTIRLDKAAAWHSFISGSSSSGLNTDFLNYRRALSNPMSQRRVLWCFSKKNAITQIDLPHVRWGCSTVHFGSSLCSFRARHSAGMRRTVGKQLTAGSSKAARRSAAGCAAGDLRARQHPGRTTSGQATEPAGYVRGRYLACLSWCCWRSFMSSSMRWRGQA